MKRPPDTEYMQTMNAYGQQHWWHNGTTVEQYKPHYSFLFPRYTHLCANAWTHTNTQHATIISLLTYLLTYRQRERAEAEGSALPLRVGPLISKVLRQISSHSHDDERGGKKKWTAVTVWCVNFLTVSALKPITDLRAGSERGPLHTLIRLLQDEKG